jgi:hypothetical protein
MISFHFEYLWGKPGKTAFRLIAVCLAAALFVTAGGFESPGMLDWIRFRMPLGYVEEGWRIVRFTSGLFASLHGAMVHLRTSLQYRAFVAGDGIGKVSFFAPRLFAECVLLTLVHVGFCAIYVLIGSLASIRFQIAPDMIERMVFSLLFVLQSASYAALIGYLTNSVLGALPMIAFCVFSMEIRLLDQINEDRVLRILTRMVSMEHLTSEGVVIVHEPTWGLLVLAGLWFLISIAYCLRDGEGT